MFANNRDGTFSEVSGVVGLDFPDDSRSFVLADLDHDGRLEVILKNRNAPQLRILHNAMKDLGHSIAFRLRGQKSNRDAIGAAITVEAGSSSPDKVSAGRIRLSGPALQGNFLWSWKDGRNHPRNDPLAEWAALRNSKTCRSTAGLRSKRVPLRLSPSPSPPQLRPMHRRDHLRRLEPLPSQVETWLIEPLKAPEFSLPDLSGNTRELQSFAGSFVLLNFWATTAPASRRPTETSPAAPISSRRCPVGNTRDQRRRCERDSKRTIVRSAGRAFLSRSLRDGRCGRHLQHHLPLPLRPSQGPCNSDLLPAGQRGHDRKGVPGPDRSSAPSGRCEDRSRSLQPSACKKLFRSAARSTRARFSAMTLRTASPCSSTAIWSRRQSPFRQVVAAKPDDPEAYYNLGTLNLPQKRFSAGSPIS